MDVKVEHIDGHVAQLTVKVAHSETEAARQKAAKRLSQKYRVPGFRPGKAPYQIIVNTFGEAGIWEEALEDITDKVYPAALEASDIDPAAPGEVAEFKPADDHIALVFNVPKAPEVDLKDYRAWRGELEIEPVTDEVLNDAVENLRESRAVVDPVQRASKEGDELELDLTVLWWHADDAHDHDHDHDHGDEEHEHEHDDEDHDHDHGDEEHEHDHDDEEHDHDHGDEEHEHDHDHEHHGRHEHRLVDDRQAKVVVRPDGDKRDMLPGFSAQLVGLSAGDEKEFQLTMPDDFEDETLRGQTLDVKLTVKEVRSRTLPELNDTFAASATNNESPTLLELRVKMRQDLEKMSQEVAEQNLMDKMLKDVIDQAEVTFHEASVREYSGRILQDVDRSLRERANVTLEHFLRLTGQTPDDMAAQYRESAITNLRRDAVLTKLVTAEKISILPEEITAEVETIADRYGDQKDTWRTILDTPDMQRDITMRLLQEKIVKRIVAIATGQNPPIEEAHPAEDSETKE